MLFSAIVFFLSLICVVGLFTARYWENERGRFLYPKYREIADENAGKLKDLIVLGREELAKLPPKALITAKNAIHKGALGVAKLANTIESRAHQLADLVSHKHRFEKRETRSEFLKQVGEHPLSNHNSSNGGGNGENVS